MLVFERKIFWKNFAFQNKTFSTPTVTKLPDAFQISQRQRSYSKENNRMSDNVIQFSKEQKRCSKFVSLHNYILDSIFKVNAITIGMGVSMPNSRSKFERFYVILFIQVSLHNVSRLFFHNSNSMLTVISLWSFDLYSVFCFKWSFG